MVKIGGSLLRCGRSALVALLETLTAGAASSSLLVVPGGGVFDDAVRRSAQTCGLSDDASHWMAILAMDAYAYLIGDLFAGTVLVDDLGEADRAAGSGRLTVLRPSRLLRARDELPHSWDVTSDSVSLWVAGACGSRRVVLLKDVDGVFPADPKTDPQGNVLPEVDAGTARALGVVDGYFDRAFGTFLPRGECWILNGTHPDRVAALLRRGTALGTRVVPPAAPA